VESRRNFGTTARRLAGEGESRRSERTVESPRGETSKPRKPLDKVELRGG
jgi:hypothetical protein